MKKLIGAIVSASMLVFGISAAGTAAFAAGDENWFKISVVGGSNAPTFSFMQSATFKSSADAIADRNNTGSYLCEKVGTSPCNSQGLNRLNALMVAPRCDAKKSNCVEEFYAYKGDEKIAGEFLGYSNDTFTKADPARNLMGDGRSASLWRIPGVLNSAGTDTYLVSPVMSFSLQGNKFKVMWVDHNVQGYSEVEEVGLEAPRSQQATGSKPRVTQTMLQPGCIWQTTNICGKPAELQAGLRLGLKFRIQNDATNWFAGRVNYPDISIAKFDAKNKVVTIEGETATISTAALTVRPEQMTSTLRNFLKSDDTDVTYPGQVGYSADTKLAMRAIDAMRSIAKDTATDTKNVWNITSLGKSGNKCLSSTNDILGIVTTNAMTYDGNVPEFKGGFLSYQVAGMHYLPDATTLAKGNYSLVMRTSAAKCLYKIGAVPVSATVEVTNDNGTKSFATTVVGEKNGWLKLQADNFTFSKKTIKVKIVKDTD